MTEPSGSLSPTIVDDSVVDVGCQREVVSINDGFDTSVVVALEHIEQSSSAVASSDTSNCNQTASDAMALEIAPVATNSGVVSDCTTALPPPGGGGAITEPSESLSQSIADNSVADAGCERTVVSANDGLVSPTVAALEPIEQSSSSFASSVALGCNASIENPTASVAGSSGVVLDCRTALPVSGSPLSVLGESPPAPIVDESVENASCKNSVSPSADGFDSVAVVSLEPSDQSLVARASKVALGCTQTSTDLTAQEPASVASNSSVVSDSTAALQQVSGAIISGASGSGSGSHVARGVDMRHSSEVVSSINATGSGVLTPDRAVATEKPLEVQGQDASDRTRSRSRHRQREEVVSPVCEASGQPRNLAEASDCRERLLRNRSRSPHLSRRHLAATGVEESQPTVPDAALRRGSPVLLVGLKSAPHLNGAEGVCVRWDADKGRWLICLTSGEEKSVKPDNLESLLVPNPSRSSICGTLAESSNDEGTSPRAGKASHRNKVFEENLAKLKAKVEEEKNLPSRPKSASWHRQQCSAALGSGAFPSQPAEGEASAGKGKGKRGTRPNSDEWSDAVLRQPLTFVAQVQTQEPSSKVTVFDPKAEARRASGEVSDDSDGELNDIGPQSIRPPPAKIPYRSRPSASWACPSPATQYYSTEDSAEADDADAWATGVAAVPDDAESVAPFSAAKAKNLSVAVSEQARKQDQVLKDALAKKKALEEGRRVIVSKLTRQLQECLAKLRDSRLDDFGREKYQDFITSLKAQLNRFSD